jgi:hypothetical protein
MLTTNGWKAQSVQTLPRNILRISDGLSLNKSSPCPDLAAGCALLP